MRRTFVSSLVCLASTLALGCPGDDGEQQPGSSEGGEGSTTVAPLDSTSTTGEATGTSTAAVDESSGGSSTGEPLPEPLPPLDAVPTTVEETVVPTHALETDPILDPRIPKQLVQLQVQGYGAYELGPGEPVTAVTPDGSPPPAGDTPSLLARFVHLCDTQIADDESPMRVALVDNPFISGAFRPQEADGCQTTNAAVRTINAVHAQTPLDFVVLGGDNADSAQTNEVQWFLDVLDGAPVVHCDSGQDDDPTPGDANDPKDRFAPVGLDVPWIWVSGNHDVLVQGNFEVDEPRSAAAIGSDVPPGGSTRDWSQPGGPVFQGPVVADEGRALVDGPTLLGLVAGSGDGHGITDEAIAAGRATYAWDVAGTDLRMIAVDSAAPTGGADGLVTDADVDGLIRPLLDQAEADGKLVLVATHHASTSLGDGSGLGGDPIPGALTTEDWQALLGEYPNVLAHLCGHSHEHRVRWVQPMGVRGYWEIITAAIADWPHQMRIMEVHDRGGGWLTLTGIALDVAIDDDPRATEARGLGILDFTSGWQFGGAGTPSDRNVQLWIPAP